MTKRDMLIREAERRERREDLARELRNFTGDVELLDQLAALDIPARDLRAVLLGGREHLEAHRRDADIRKEDHAAGLRLRRKGEMEGRFWEVEGSNGPHRLYTLEDGSSHWRHAPRPVRPGNPEQRIKAGVRRRLVDLGIKDEKNRGIRERLLDSI